jgi:hypothetical protein
MGRFITLVLKSRYIMWPQKGQRDHEGVEINAHNMVILYGSDLQHAITEHGVIRNNS